jgi:hypothetical protein
MFTKLSGHLVAVLILSIAAVSAVDMMTDPPLTKAQIICVVAVNLVVVEMAVAMWKLIRRRRAANTVVGPGGDK